MACWNIYTIYRLFLLVGLLIFLIDAQSQNPKKKKIKTHKRNIDDTTNNNLKGKNKIKKSKNIIQTSQSSSNSNNIDHFKSDVKQYKKKKDTKVSEKRLSHVDRFIQSLENGINELDATEQHQIDRSIENDIKIFKKSINQVAPIATSLMGKYCSSNVTDEEMNEILKQHYKSCRKTIGLWIEVSSAVKNGTMVKAPNDFPRECKGVCYSRLQGITAQLTRDFKSREDRALGYQDELGVFTRLCLPVADAIVSQCGERPGADFTAIAKSHAEAGNLDVILSASRLGYMVVDETNLLDTRSHVPHLLLHGGFTDLARQFLSEFPQYLTTKDRFGISASGLLKAKSYSLSEVPLEMQHMAYLKLRDDIGSEGRKNVQPTQNDKQDSSFVSDLGHFRAGGWSTDFIEFPGYDTCEIAELDGKEVVKDSSLLIKHFLLTNRPVIIRDFIQYDKGGIEDLLSKMSRSELVHTWGHTKWDVGSIPYEKTYTGVDAVKMNLSSYVDLVHYGENMNSDGIPQYIFSDPVSQHGVEVSAADLFPQNPKFVEDGIPDEIVTNKMSGQFFLGSPGTGAAIHYHTNTAWNAVVYGRKGWVLTPPPTAIFSSRPSTIKVKEMADRKEGYRCIQYAGDVLLAPMYWGHLTYNLATSIGMAKEFGITPAANKIIEYSKLKNKNDKNNFKPKSLIKDKNNKDEIILEKKKKHKKLENIQPIGKGKKVKEVSERNQLKNVKNIKKKKKKIERKVKSNANSPGKRMNHEKKKKKMSQKKLAKNGVSSFQMDEL